jgi:hypothetical protein
MQANAAPLAKRDSQVADSSPQRAAPKKELGKPGWEATLWEI